MKYQFLRDHAEIYRVEKMCRMLEVSRSGYYVWRKRPMGRCRGANLRLVKEIRAVHQISKETYGSPGFMRNFVTTPRSLLHHSDRGSQYASGDYRALLEEHGLVCSMSRKRDCYDNAAAENFFSSLKKDRVHHGDYTTRAEARRDLFDYIEVFHNRLRRHSYLGYCTRQNSRS
jgi:Integrase core domain.